MRFPGRTLFSPPKPAQQVIQEPEPAPPPVEVPEPAVAPVPDDKAAKNAKRRKFAETRRRSGRLSTINTSAPSGTALG